MKLSVKSDYAARAVLWLSRHYGDGVSRRVEDMASEQGIPSNYLVQILIELKSKQIVKSRRGKDGGYQLARSPAEITLGDVIRCMHGEVFDSTALSDSRCPPELKDAWLSLQRSLNSAADSITFQKLLDVAAGKEKMYYI